MAVQLPLAGLAPADTALPETTLLETLWPYPDCSTESLQHNAKPIGQAGELFVDSMLTRFGLTVLALPENQPSDRLVLVGDVALYLQVKTVTRPNGGRYGFQIARGYHRAPSGVRPYDPDAFDLLALVVLPENVVMFTAERRGHHGIPVRAIPSLRARPRDTLEEALRHLGVPLPGAWPSHPCDRAAAGPCALAPGGGTVTS